MEGRRGVVCKQLQEAQGRVTLSSLPAASPPRTSTMHLRGSASEKVHPKVASRRHVAGGLGRFSGASDGGGTARTQVRRSQTNPQKRGKGDGRRMGEDTEEGHGQSMERRCHAGGQRVLSKLT